MSTLYFAHEFSSCWTLTEGLRCHIRVQSKAPVMEDYSEIGMQHYQSYSTNKDDQETSSTLFSFSQIISDSELSTPLVGESFILSEKFFFPP